MNYIKLKSYAKINLSLNITGKKTYLHKIESIIAFVDLYDLIMIKPINSKKNIIEFSGIFSKGIKKNNSVSKMLSILKSKKLLTNKNFKIKINKQIPNKAGLGGGSMNAANILGYFIKKKIIRTNKKEIETISRAVGSDVILGLNSSPCILTSNNRLKYFKKFQKLHVLIVKPNFGCSTKEIYSKVRKFQKPKINKPKRYMFNPNYLKNMNNSLEPIVFSKHSKLKSIKSFLEDSTNPVFVRMSGSGSALVAYFRSKERCENAKKIFYRKYKNYWYKVSKTI